MRDLRDRVVLLTGGSRGLGLAMADAFAARGARIALVARSGQQLDDAAAALRRRGATAMGFAADVRDPDSLGTLVTVVEDALGPVDVLVNNAGIEDVRDFETLSPQRIQDIVTTNLLGPLWLARLLAPSMIERRAGHIVNVSSLSGVIADPHNSVYCATKHGLVGMSRALRIELADHDVGVSVVCPTYVSGGMFLDWGRQPPSPGEMVTPAAVADAVVGAVLRNRPYVVVSRGLGRFGDWIQALTPGLGEHVLRWSGVTAFNREQARINAARHES